MERGRAWSPAQGRVRHVGGTETPTIRSSWSREVSIAQHEGAWVRGQAGRRLGLLS